tara:strand:- start:1941 stop:2612 length:672 start_codon:yes stop_codon:yes gene_type:complete
MPGLDFALVIIVSAWNSNLMTTKHTSLTMLDGIRKQDADQWNRFVQLFGPIVYEWCRRNGISEHDSADIVQEVFQVVAEKILEFRREQPGDSFHGWLYGITRFKCLDYFRARGKQVVATGGTTAMRQIQDTPDSEFQDFPTAEIDSMRMCLYRRALELIKTEFESKTWQAFWKITIEEAHTSDVSDELGMTPGAIHNAKYKVLRRLRSEFEGLVPFPDDENIV